MLPLTIPCFCLLFVFKAVCQSATHPQGSWDHPLSRSDSILVLHALFVGLFGNLFQIQGYKTVCVYSETDNLLDIVGRI